MAAAFAAAFFRPYLYVCSGLSSLSFFRHTDYERPDPGFIRFPTALGRVLYADVRGKSSEPRMPAVERARAPSHQKILFLHEPADRHDRLEGRVV